MVKIPRPAKVDPRPECFSSTLKECFCIFTLTFAPAAASMATGAYQISINKVADHFHVAGGILTWSISSVGLANGSLLLLMGSIADLFGRRYSVLAAFTLYSMFSLIGGFMSNYIALCIFRALQGVVVAVGTPAAAGIIGANYPIGRRKNRAFACFAAGAPLGMCFGLVVGGIAAEFSSWRAIHFFNTVWYAILATVAFITIPKDEDTDLSKKGKLSTLKELDYMGAFLSLTGFTLFCFSLTQVDVTVHGWKTPYIIALLIVGSLLIIALFMWEKYVPRRPLMPMEMWSNSRFTRSITIMSLLWLCFAGTLTYFSILFFENVQDRSPLLTTAYILPMGIVGILTNIFIAFTLHVIPGKILLLAASLSFCGSAAIWATVSKNRLYWAGPFQAISLSVIGADTAYNVCNMVTMTSVSKNLQSSAAGVFNTVIQLSGAVGLAISSAVVNARNPLYGTPHQNDDPAKLLDGFRNAWYCAIGYSVVAVILSCFLKIGTYGNSQHDEAEPEIAPETLPQGFDGKTNS
ncbi:BA75_00116T0 [Komagataella pastoris]|uniref:BA75_00116T0 n=1 Tax=Komagataella pastoris TaxID=4922 RepID=A0A1B2J7X6_PICPA|nr:BA75_00116T0 [Komagataella pastoris]